MLGTIPDPTGPPELDIAGMVEYLKRNGYTVRKARQAKEHYSEYNVDVRRCIHCGLVAARTVLIGGKKARDKREVGICADCYRFGPHKHAMPLVPADPARAARLYRVWRRAHNRYARRRRLGNRYVTSAHELAFSLLRAMTEQKMERSYVPTDMFGRLIGEAAAA